MVTMLHQEHHILQWLIQQSILKQQQQNNHLVHDFDCVFNCDEDHIDKISESQTLDNQSTQLPDLENKLLGYT